MIIAHFQIYRYSLPFIRPMAMLQQTLRQRDGLLVKLQSDDGRFAFGDVPPFPGLSDESLDAAAAQLHQVCAHLQGKDFQQRDACMVVPLSESLHPSVRYGIESAWIDLAAQERGVPIAALFSSSAVDKIALNALLTGPASELPALAHALVESGYKALKIKIGRDSPTAESNMVREIHLAAGRDVALRLDANRAWRLQQAIRFGQSIADVPIEYLEEPLVDANHDSLVQFHDETGIPVALDESKEELRRPVPGVVAVIIKPGIDGGVFDCIRMVQRARELDIKPVLSSAYLSAVGLRTAAQLAAAYAQPNEIHGLATSLWLARDFVAAPVKITNGCLDVGHLNENISAPAFASEILR